MPVELSIIETESAVGVVVSQVVLESVSEPGPPGVGVPAGGTVGQVLAKDSGTDFDTSWQDAAGGTVDEIVAGAGVSIDASDPAAPIVTAEVTQAELDAEAALARNADNLTSGTVADARIAGTIARDSEVSAAIAASEAAQVRDGDTAGGVLSGTYPNPGFAADMATQAELDAEAATRAAADTALDGRLDTLEAAGPYVESVVAGTNVTVDATDPANPIVSASGGGGGSGVVETIVAGSNIDVDSTDPANPVVSVEALVDADIPAGIARDAEVAAAYATIDEPIAAAHIADTTDAHDASAISIADAGNDFTATDVEGALAELQADHEADVTALSDHAADTTGIHGIADTSALETTSGAQAKADAKVDDTAYDATSWNGVTTTAPSKNAVRDKVETLAPLASPTFTGTPAAPTAAQGTNTTQLATTAYVQTEAGLLVPKSVVDAKGDLLVGTADNTVGRKAAPANGSLLTADSAQSTGWADLTRASLAADTAFSSAYAPLTTSLFLPAASFSLVSGSPVLGAVSSSLAGFLFDAGGTEVVSAVTQLPPGWATFDVELWWTNGGAGSGNVVWRLDVSGSFGDSESADPSSAGSNTTATAPTALTNRVTTVRTGLSVPTSGEAIAIRPRRIGADGSDTLANDACLIGVRLVKAS